MAVILAKAVLAHTSGIPADADNVDFVFHKDGVTATALQASIDSAGAVQQMFNFAAVGAGGIGVGSYLSAAIRRDGLCSVEYYDITTHLDGSPHGSPIGIVHFDILDPVGTETVPAEASAVVTLFGSGRDAAAVKIPDPDHPGKFLRPKQRRTGRLYIGPLNSAAFQASAGEVYLHPGFVDALKAAASQVNVQAAAVGAFWDVWSRADAAVHSIYGGRIDNAPDVQRRRGVEASTRTLWP